MFALTLTYEFTVPGTVLHSPFVFAQSHAPWILGAIAVLFAGILIWRR